MFRRITSRYWQPLAIECFWYVVSVVFLLDYSLLSICRPTHFHLSEREVFESYLTMGLVISVL